ncbi:MAG TPA: Ig-like domain repeat protein [Acidimicrobiales bacterium]
MLSATVTGSGSILPTGTVTFKSGSTVLCTTSTFTTVNSHTISASCSLTNLALTVSTYPVTATYSGNSHYSTSSSSPTQNLVVSKDTSTTKVAESAPSGNLGSENTVIFSATVTSGNGEAIPTGEGVTIHVGTATCAGTTNALGVASCSISASALLGGTGYAVSATYAGDTNINSSTSSNSLSFTVNAKPVFTSANSTSATVWRSFSFHVTATGYPAPTFSISGHLPNGVTFNAATGVLSGTPALGTSGTYVITFSATNAGGTTTQSFTLTVRNLFGRGG